MVLFCSHCYKLCEHDEFQLCAKCGRQFCPQCTNEGALYVHRCEGAKEDECR